MPFGRRPASPIGSRSSWIDEGADVDAAALRRTAGGAVGRAGADARTADGTNAGSGISPASPPSDAEPAASADDGSWSLEADLARAVGPGHAKKMGERVAEAARAFERQRFDEARRLLKPLAEQAPQSAAIRELYGLSLIAAAGGRRPRASSRRSAG